MRRHKRGQMLHRFLHGPDPDTHRLAYSNNPLNPFSKMLIAIIPN